MPYAHFRHHLRHYFFVIFAISSFAITCHIIIRFHYIFIIDYLLFYCFRLFARPPFARRCR